MRTQCPNCGHEREQPDYCSNCTVSHTVTLVIWILMLVVLLSIGLKLHELQLNSQLQRPGVSPTLGTCRSAQH
jgi:hypothetical protein